VLQVNDLSRSLASFDPISTLVVVVEMSKTSSLVSGAVLPGVERQPLKKLIIEMGNDPMEFFDSLHATFPNAMAGQRNGAEIRKWISEVVAAGSLEYIDVLFRR
jgi:hypothetical protein